MVILAERRKRRKLQMSYNIPNNNAPMYLCDVIPPTIQSVTVYPLHNEIWQKRSNIDKLIQNFVHKLSGLQ